MLLAVANSSGTNSETDRAATDSGCSNVADSSNDATDRTATDCTLDTHGAPGQATREPT